MKHKLLRGLVAVVLVCCLVVSWSPIRANAVGTEQYVAVVIDKVGFYAQAGAVSTGAAVFGYVLAGIGLVVSTARLIEIMNDYMEWSGELETSIYYYPDGSWSYGVDVGFIDRVRAFAFERGYLVDTGNLTTVVPEGQTYRTYTANAPCVAFMYSYSYYTPSRSQYYFAKTGYLVCSVPDYQFSVNGNKATSTVKFNDNSYYFYSIYSGAQYLYKAELTAALSQPSDFYYVGDCGTTYTLSKVLKNYGWGGIQGTGDIATDYVASPDVSIDIAYPEWYVNARPALQPDTNEEVTVLPIPLNPSVAPETQIGTLTQPDIWQGSIADPMPGTDSVPDGSIAETPWEAFKKWISEGWKSIIQAIPTAESIGQAVGNVIKSIFVPDADFITEKWNDIRSRFEFADSITATGEVLVDILDGLDPEPPVIYIDLGAAEGSYNIGGEVPFVDLRWYARYKPTMDLIISAFLWLAFVWRLILKLPGIISGMPGEFFLLALPMPGPIRGSDVIYGEAPPERKGVTAGAWGLVKSHSGAMRRSDK